MSKRHRILKRRRANWRKWSFTPPDPAAIERAAKCLMSMQSLAFKYYLNQLDPEYVKAIRSTMTISRTTEFCKICGHPTKDWVDPDWAHGRICRKCETRYGPKE